ncbi:hypothetical protein FIBSPDRAFT_884483 [Athelia psychrophila]|uniref:Uncharacterized protein n=1 Tax=Athelia psychrophila TaxID=1759441 RepID=A0A166T6D2_9AGAM|nr:hypothetical protein FIBSPDRAFT_884483 [Fibularhizoctonia sp. CBS 109695]
MCEGANILSNVRISCQTIDAEAMLLCCEMLSLVKHGYLGAVGDYRGKGLIGAVPSHRRDMSDSSAEVDVLFKQSSKIDMPDGSRYFAAAASPIFPHQVHTIRGAFLPHHPFIFYMAWSAGPLDTPWLYLPAFKLCVTRGNRLHDEEDFSYYQARTRVVVDGQPFSPPITLLIPHRIGYPGPGSWRKDDLSSRISLADLELSEVEIRTYRTRQWVWGDLDRNQWSAGQSESFDRLNESWDMSRRAHVSGAGLSMKYRGPEGDKFRLSYGDFIQWHNPMDRNSRQSDTASAAPILDSAHTIILCVSPVCGRQFAQGREAESDPL